MLNKIRDYVSISFISQKEIEKVQINKMHGKNNFKAKKCGLDASRAVLGGKIVRFSLQWGPKAVWGPTPKPPESKNPKLKPTSTKTPNPRAASEN